VSVLEASRSDNRLSIAGDKRYFSTHSRILRASYAMVLVQV